MSLARNVAVGVCAVVALCQFAFASPTIVYDNTTTPLKGGFDTHGVSEGYWPFRIDDGWGNEPMGNLAKLAPGTSRTISQFDLMLSSSGPVTLDSLTVAFYAYDPDPQTNEAEIPTGSSFWSTTRQGVQIDGLTRVSFSVPEVQIAGDCFAWAANADCYSAGMAIFGPPTVGGTDDVYFDYYQLYPSGPYDWYRGDFEGDPPATFGATIYANPEPASVLLLTAGAVCGLRRRRR